MTLPRSKYVRNDIEGFYHCSTRCVRRAFLYGYDAHSQRDFSHRKTWILNRLRFLSTIFAIQVCAYAIMENHYHLILRLLPHLVAAWSDREVALRWLALFPHHDRTPSESEIAKLTSSPQRIALLRQRLSSLSWFMARINEFIARAANKEDDVKGRFWESRFKSQALLDIPAIIAGLVYVDLNVVRAGIAPSPELSDFTSIQERIRTWQNDLLSDPSQNPASHPSCWLCPIQSDSIHPGILPMSLTDYFDLVDKSGRILRSEKRGAIDPNLAPILSRIGANPSSWLNTISHFGSSFHLAAGRPSSLRLFAQQLSQHWVSGLSAASAAFSPSPPLPA